MYRNRPPLQQQQHPPGNPAWRLQQQAGHTDWQPGSPAQAAAHPDIAEDSGNRGDARHPSGTTRHATRHTPRTPQAGETPTADDARRYARAADAQIDA